MELVYETGWLDGCTCGQTINGIKRDGYTDRNKAIPVHKER
jgi:hypothetical protein